MNQYQAQAACSYADGEYQGIDPEHIGDTLFTFVMRELSEKEDCDCIEAAISRMEMAAHEIEQVLNGLHLLQERAT